MINKVNEWIKDHIEMMIQNNDKEAIINYN